jgi:Arc-like DNA binding domain
MASGTRLPLWRRARSRVHIASYPLSAGRCVTLSHVPEASVVKSVRLPRALVERLTAQAKTEHRTVNNLITKILTESLDNLTETAIPVSPEVSDSKDTA